MKETIYGFMRKYCIENDMILSMVESKDFSRIPTDIKHALLNKICMYLNDMAPYLNPKFESVIKNFNASKDNGWENPNINALMNSLFSTIDECYMNYNEFNEFIRLAIKHPNWVVQLNNGANDKYNKVRVDLD